VESISDALLRIADDGVARSNSRDGVIGVGRPLGVGGLKAKVCSHCTVEEEEEEEEEEEGA
jgi:hypothetical protein